MSSGLELAFSELKSKGCAINDVSSRISAVEIGEIIQVDLGKVSAAEVKRAIGMAARAGRKAFDHVIDKKNRRILIKRLPGPSGGCVEKRIGEVKDKIINMVSEAGTAYESAVRQRITRTKSWESLVADVGGSGVLIDDILTALIAQGKLRKSGPMISVD